MNIIKQSLGLGVALLLLSNLACAVDRPQTMDEMWKIIEAQQKQLDAMQKMLEENSVTYARDVSDDPYSFLPGWLHSR